MKNTLYFESCGCAEYNGVNCRIRTAFKNKDEKEIFLTLFAGHKCDNKTKQEQHYIVCESCHYIDSEEKRIRNTNQTEYTLENIKNFVNTHCNCEFEEIVVLPDLAGYHVFGNNNKYNLMDDFVYDEERTKRYERKVEELKEQFKRLFHQKYDNTSYYVQNGNLMVKINVSDSKLKEAGWTEGRCLCYTPDDVK